MARKKKNRQYQNPGQIMADRAMDWYTHYYQYLTSISYQLFEWKNLPDSVDPRFLEMMLHQQGYVGFFKSPTLGYIATQGSLSGTVDHYYLPTHFHAVAPNYQDTFRIYNYRDIKSDAGNKKMGVVIFNNDYHFSTIPSLQIFAQDLAELKEVIYVNQNAQKTPILIKANDNSLFSIKNLYNQYEGNAPVILANENIDPDSVQVLKTDAPYVVDKLNTQKNAVWNEVMTFLGIKNANQEKRERMITAEADSNNEQILNSGNVFLKSRREAADRINELYDLNIEVDFRVDAIVELQNQIDPTYMGEGEGENRGKLHDATP